MHTTVFYCDISLFRSVKKKITVVLFTHISQLIVIGIIMTYIKCKSVIPTQWEPPYNCDWLFMSHVFGVVMSEGIIKEQAKMKYKQCLIKGMLVVWKWQCMFT